MANTEMNNRANHSKRHDQGRVVTDIDSQVSGHLSAKCPPHQSRAGVVISEVGSPQIITKDFGLIGFAPLNPRQRFGSEASI